MQLIQKTFKTQTEADEWVKEYMRDYHPAGYGTTERPRHVNPLGLIEVTIVRGDSCD